MNPDRTNSASSSAFGAAFGAFVSRIRGFALATSLSGVSALPLLAADAHSGLFAEAPRAGESASNPSNASEDASLDPFRIVAGVSSVAILAGAVLVYRWRTRTKNVLAAYDVSIADLRASKERAEELAASRSSILATMSHELRTPVTAVMGFAELLLEPGQDAATRRSHIQTIRRNGQHLLMVLNDTLDLSKIEAGALHVESTPCDLREVAREIVDMFQQRAVEKHLRLEWSCEGELPSLVRTDPRRLRQILMNVVANAVKFTQNGAVRIVLRHEPTRRQVVLEVTDTGVGIEPRVIESIFTPYRQSDGSTTARFGGTGLGLAISRRLAQALGGDISVRSAETQGSTFCIAIPDTTPYIAFEESTSISPDESAPRGGAGVSACARP